jgi:hypothetical protein
LPGAMSTAVPSPDSFPIDPSVREMRGQNRANARSSSARPVRHHSAIVSSH